ncbi:MAG TPA: glycosyl hydrolase family 28 protein [Planctomycetota bacterium]|jgi:hypothetical protein
MSSCLIPRSAVVTMAIVLLAAVNCSRASDSLNVYPAPKGAALNSSFSVKVRVPGSAWQDLAVYDVRIDLFTLSQAAFAYFDFTGKVEVLVSFNGGEAKTIEVRPKSSGITPKLDGKTAAFELDRPRNLSIEVNGDKLHNLHLFAGEPEKDVPSKDDPNVIFFGPGLHTLGSHLGIISEGKVGGKDKAIIKVPSGKTVYLAGGSVVQAAIKLADKASNVTIRGRGILDLSPWNEPKGHFVKDGTWQTGGITLPFTSNTRIEGIIIKQPTGYVVLGGKADGVTIEGLKGFSAHEWADGIDMMSSSNVRISGVFLRNSDDCIAIYGSRWSFRGDSRKWLVQDSTFWADKAHPIYMGVHGAFEGDGDILEDFTFRNIDILESNEPHHGFRGALSIGCGDKNTCRNITFDDVRVEHIRDAGGRLIDVQFKHYQPSTVDGRGIQNITFRKIVYNGPKDSLLEGKGPDRMIQGVVFEGLKINGKPVLKAEDGSIVIGKFVSGIEFK